MPVTRLDGQLIRSGSIPSSAITGSFSASFATTSSFARSGSFATTASAATSITFFPVTSSFSTTSSFVTTPIQCNDGQVIRPRFTDYAETYTTPSISANVLTLNLETGNVFRVALNQNISTLTISNPSGNGNACSFTLIFDANGTGYTITWPGAVKWPGGTAPTVTTTNGRSDMFVFYTNNAGTTWYAMTAAQNFVTT